MQACKNLGLLRISANQIETLPEWLVKLPKLAWLAFSGNPCADSIHEQDEIELVNWDEIELTSQIGEGASGIISKGIWKTKNKAIAVKMFTGEVTSDGYPGDELATCLATGKHPNLVPLLAQIINHPEGKDGIVMDLIPDTFSNLGQPPSFKTCTRDVFNPTLELEEETTFNIIKHTANAAKHLHIKGILHGDLYAHNTLYNATGETYLGDFGAASFYSKTNPFSNLIERLDVRAFGYLMDDLISHTNFQNDNLKQKLKELRNLCLHENVAERPGFEDILELINNL